MFVDSGFVRLFNPKITYGDRKNPLNNNAAAMLSLHLAETLFAFFFCLTKWRMYWNFDNGENSSGRIVYTLTFCGTSVFILLMSVINYITAATAYAIKRAHEIGVRKMTGATKGILIRQFMTESIITSLVAFCISLLTSHLILPYFNLIKGVNRSNTLTMYFLNIDTENVTNYC
jgi:hypothetical protein